MVKEPATGGAVVALLRERRLRPPAQQRRARPVRVGGDERGIAAEIRRCFGVTQDEPFDQFLGRGICALVPGGGRVVGLCLAREIDGFLHQREVARERRCGLLARRLILRWLRFALGVGMPGVPVFFNCGGATRASLLPGARFLGLVRLCGLLVLFAVPAY